MGTSRGSGGSRTTRTRRTKTPGEKAAIIGGTFGLIATIVAAFVTGFFGLIDNNGTDDSRGPQPSASVSTQPPGPSPLEAEPSSAACDGERVSLDAPTDVGPTYDLGVTVNCPPLPGEKYYLIAEVASVGRPGTEHPLYCPRGKLGGTVGTQTYEQDLHKAPAPSARTIYVLSVNSQEEQELFRNPVQDNCKLRLPDTADKVSAPKYVVRSW